VVEAFLVFETVDLDDLALVVLPSQQLAPTFLLCTLQ
jgi:hypothetical protein